MLIFKVIWIWVTCVTGWTCQNELDFQRKSTHLTQASELRPYILWQPKRQSQACVIDLKKMLEWLSQRITLTGHIDYISAKRGFIERKCSRTCPVTPFRKPCRSLFGYYNQLWADQSISRNSLLIEVIQPRATKLITKYSNASYMDCLSYH